MFKDYDKYLSTTLKVYLFVLVIIFILKLVGLDYFGLDLNNHIILKVDKFLSGFWPKVIYYLIFLMFYQYLMLSIICKDKSNKFKLLIICTFPLTYMVQRIKELNIDHNILTTLLEMFYLYLIVIIYNIKTKKMSYIKISKRFLIVIILNILFQFISTATRFKYEKYISQFIPNLILNLDYVLLLLITQKIVFTEKGAENKCYQEQVGLYSLKKINLKQSLKKLQRNFQSNHKKFQSKPKEEKLAIIIYIILSLIWNTLTVLLVLFVAFLNDTLIECIFILTSFWLSKTAFGQPFHFDSMLKCFIVSNLSYYVLNRVTTPLGISILIPICLGVGLSYFTSKFVKKSYKPLYRGMPFDVFEDTILKVVEKDSIKYKICYEFYIEKSSDLSLSFKYNYSVSGIRKIKDRINTKIKKLK